ncbi:MAG: hypothetical protein IT365_19040 [Candidatus Hydrogenedentes bacterium]|nr:hypothetical protein [Candidatus Hydrogenedentota bacterium]
MRILTVFGLLILALLGTGWLAWAQSSDVVKAELNGLHVTIDASSGGLLKLEYADMTMLQATPESASLLDAAYPGYGFEPLRLGTRYSKDARVEVVDGALHVTWDALGMSRAFAPEGRVSASVRIEPAPGGHNVAITASIDNQSSIAIPQVLFPDLAGLLPFAGEDGTELRTCGFAMKPFRDLNVPVDDGRWYASRRNWMELKSGAYDKSMGARWMDFGSLKGGFSLFPRLWSWGPLNAAGEPVSEYVRLHRSQTDGTLRIMCEHRVTIAPGERWSSPEYILTPHEHGWAKGVESFRSWVNENVQRPYPLPEHLRKSLGYRTVWMAQQYANADPSEPTVVWKFRDLPDLAMESKAHGLNEMVVWLWQPWEIPKEPSPELGTLEEFNQAIEACRAVGVNVSLFVSVMTMLDPIPSRYGWNDGQEYWGYHSDFVPMLRPYYGTASRGSFADLHNAQWQGDVTASLLNMIARGWHSITWDQARHAPGEPNLETIFSRVRSAAKARNPEATYSAENLNNLDLDSRWLDYTWNWALFDENLDWRVLTNAYATPRFNVNVGASPRTVKRLFMDHLFMNVMPSKPEGINGSARIADCPELSRALKICAALHEQFLPYFEDGIPVGDCVLSAPCPGARISGYLRSDGVLLVVTNTSDQAQAIAFDCDLAPWLDSPSGEYFVKPYDEAGTARAPRTETAPSWRETTPILKPDELALYVVQAGPPS